MSQSKFLRKHRVRKYVNLGNKKSKNIDDAISKQSTTFEKQDKNFSLGSMSTELMIIENPNIIEDKDFTRLTNKEQLADNKFDNASDPFYELDDERSQIETIEKLDITVSDRTKQKILKTSKKQTKNTKRRY